MTFIPSQIMPIASIVEDEDNYNTHPDEQIHHLDKSLDDFGQYKNIVVWQGRCIAGNGVLKAAKQRGETEIEVKDFSHLSREEAQALLLADNALPSLAVPDVTKLERLVELTPGEIPGVTQEWLSGLRGQTQEEIALDAPDFESDPSTVPVLKIQVSDLEYDALRRDITELLKGYESPKFV
jgi:hypothetical protein